jgi:hypothetical protein
MEVRLVCRKAAPLASSSLHAEETVIGRQSGRNIRIPSEDVSCRHCICMENGVLMVEDLQSNGTYVNGRPAPAGCGSGTGCGLSRRRSRRIRAAAVAVPTRRRVSPVR